MVYYVRCCACQKKRKKKKKAKKIDKYKAEETSGRRRAGQKGKENVTALIRHVSQQFYNLQFNNSLYAFTSPRLIPFHFISIRFVCLSVFFSPRICHVLLQFPIHLLLHLLTTESRQIAKNLNSFI